MDPVFIPPLLKPAKYYPFMNGKYEVAAGLRPWGTDFSNGELDQKAIQIDNEYSRYLENKDECRDEKISKYCCFHDFESVAYTVSKFLIKRMTEEYPAFFVFEDGSECTTGCSVLHCKLTEEKLIFNLKSIEEMRVSTLKSVLALLK